MNRSEMNRRTFLKTGIAGSAALTLGGCGSMRSSRGKEKPNLIFVMADQLGVNHCGYADYWNGNYAGAEHASTPNLDQFAKESMNFTNCVASMPVCCAYRATLMTGKYTTSHGVVINNLRLQPTHECIGHALTRAGYETAYIGKWHLYSNVLDKAQYEPHQSFVPRGPFRLGFDGFWAAYNYAHDYYGSHYFTESEEKVFYPEGVYEPDGQTDLAIDWLRRTQGSGKPMAMVLSWGTPHLPWTLNNVPPEYYARFSQTPLPNPPNYSPVNDEPYSDAWGDLNLKQRTSLETWRRIYYAMTANLDWNFGRLMRYLDQNGLSDNTIVVFSSDHGEMFGSHGRKMKNTFYEEAARIPFLVRWPRHIPAAATSNACISNVDFMPSLLGLLDLHIPSDVEGMNLAHLMLGQTGLEPEFAFLQNTGSCAAWADGYEWRAVRTKRFTYARYRTDGKELLFDNIADPYQMTNLANDRESAATLQELRGKMNSKMAALNDTFEASSYYRKNWTDGSGNILRTATTRWNV